LEGVLVATYRTTVEQVAEVRQCIRGLQLLVKMLIDRENSCKAMKEGMWCDETAIASGYLNESAHLDIDGLSYEIGDQLKNAFYGYAYEVAAGRDFTSAALVKGASKSTITANTIISSPFAGNPFVGVFLAGDKLEIVAAEDPTNVGIQFTIDTVADVAGDDVITATGVVLAAANAADSALVLRLVGRS